jgi:hypothetical protein
MAAPVFRARPATALANRRSARHAPCGNACATNFNTISTGYFLPINDFVGSMTEGSPPRHKEIAAAD